MQLQFMTYDAQHCVDLVIYHKSTMDVHHHKHLHLINHYSSLCVTDRYLHHKNYAII